MVLRDEEWFTESDRWIADQCAVNKDTVTKWRANLEATGEIRQLNERKGKDGKTRKLPQPKAPPLSLVPAEPEPLPEEVEMPDEEHEVRLVHEAEADLRGCG